MSQSRFEITDRDQVDIAQGYIPLIGEQEQVGGFLLAECPINEIERFDVVQGYAAEWRKAFGLIPQDLGPSENLALARKFGPTAKQHEVAITATLAEIKARRIEIMRPAPDKLAVAETLDRAEKVLDELLMEIKKTRLDTEKRVEGEMERRKLDTVNAALQRIGAASAELFFGPLSAVPLQGPTERLRNAGKGKKTPETCIAAINAEAEVIIAERTALAAICSTNLDLINAADLPAVSAETVRLLPLPTDYVQGLIAQRRAEAELAAAKKQSAVQREPEKLAVLKAEVQKMVNLYHMSNWQRKHKNDLAHPDDQAELWQFFGAHYDRVESRNKPPHPADAYQAAPQGPPVQHPEPTRQPAAVHQSSPQPAAPEREQESEIKAAAAPVQPAPPAAPIATERPEGMPETGFAFRMKFHCGELDEEGMQRLYNQICDAVEAAGGEVFEARKI